jgi:hypothetical protein
VVGAVSLQRRSSLVETIRYLRAGTCVFTAPFENRLLSGAFSLAVATHVGTPAGIRLAHHGIVADFLLEKQTRVKTRRVGQTHENAI